MTILSTVGKLAGAVALWSIVSPVFGADALRVAVTWAGPAHPDALHFQITNAMSDPVPILEDSLPWKNPGRVLILAKAPGMEPLRPVYLPHDVFRQPIVVLKAGDTLDGLVDMTQHLRDVPLALTKGRVVVFWYYAPSDAASKPLGEYGGWIGIQTSAVAPPP
jgi:hypothetical protein